MQTKNLVSQTQGGKEQNQLEALKKKNKSITNKLKDRGTIKKSIKLINFSEIDKDKKKLKSQISGKT